jgi:Tol biopolymer transport system component
MREKRLFVLYALSVVMLCASICPVFAKAPDTPKIIFGTVRDGNWELYLMNTDGSEQINITNHRAIDSSGTWSPTGEQILFISDRDRSHGSWDLYLMDPDGKNVRSVFEKSEERRHPEWSPDGKQIAYKRFDGGVGYIYIATSDGKNEERVAIGGTPAWSPDGTEIAYVVRVAPDRLNIYILNVRTRKQKHFFPPDDISTAREPAWSPDGTKIAFMWHQKRPQDDGEIYTLNRDGTGLQELVNHPEQGVTASVWDPGGKALIYSQQVGNWERHIFKIMLADGTSEQLTDVSLNNPGDWFDPAYALPVSPQPQLLTTQWGDVKKGN